MNRQRAQQAQQNAAPQQRNALLRHAAVHPVADQELSFNETTTGLEHDFSQLPASPATSQLGQPASNASCSVSPQRCPFGGACHSCPPHIQAKLKIGQPGDKYEQEADRVAEQVMGMPEPQVQRKEGCSSCEGKEEDDDKLIQAKPLFGQITSLPSSVQRKTEHKAEKDEDEDKILQAKSTGRTWNAHAHSDHPLIRNALSSPGQPLDAATRSFMEPRFGQDFSGVRVHEDSNAHRANTALKSRAFTHGNHILLGKGESQNDLILMAHEATHVLQQDDVLRRKPANGKKKSVGGSDDQAATPSAATPSTASPAQATGSSGRGGISSSGAEAAPAPAAQTPGQEEATRSPSAESATSAIASTGVSAEAGGPELLMPEPPEGLSVEEQERLTQVEGEAAETATAQEELPSADENVAEAREAVEEPTEETAGRAGGDVTSELGAMSPPSPEVEALCQRIITVINSRQPPSEAAVLVSNPAEEAQAAGQIIEQSVEGEVEETQSSYDQIEEEPEGVPSREPQEIELPPEQVATPGIDAESATPDEVSAEDVSLDADVEASETRIDEAGMSSEPAQLVESGPIAEAREAQGELSETAQRDPQEVLAEHQTVRDQAAADLAALRNRAVASMQESRVATIGGTTSQQQAGKLDEETQRRQVGQQAQQIFQSAQSLVNSQLEPLPRTAMDMWNGGVQVLKTEYDQAIGRIQNRLRERYEGISGAVLEFAEDIVGKPAWVTRGYNEAELRFGQGACDLIRRISSEVNTVIDSCQAIIDDANTQIDSLFDANLPEGLQAWAQGQRAQYAERLAGLRNRVATTQADFTRDLVQTAGQAVQEMRERTQQLRDAARGLLGRIEDAINAFIEDPARFIIEGLLELVGIPPASFWGLIDRIGQVINDIADDPMNFANNLATALGQGFQQFFDNFKDHIIGGFFDWLFSGLGAVGVQIPSDFSLGSLITFFLQLMGITWARIRQILARHIGEENVALIEKAYELIATLIERGPEGIFEMIKEQLNPQTILSAILDAAVDYLIEALIKAVTPRIIGMFNPAGAIVQAIEVVYRILAWIFNNAARIFSLVETVVNGAAELISGNTGGMATAVEGALARLIAPVIDFLAGFLGLGDLPDTIADTIRGFQEMVLGVIERVVAWLAERARGMLRALGIGEDEDAVDEEDPEKADRVRAGLSAIDTEEQRFVEGGKISHEEAEQVARSVQQSHPIFTRLTVVDGGDSWDYKWEASPGDTKETPAKKEEGNGGTPENYKEIIDLGLEGKPVADFNPPPPKGYSKQRMPNCDDKWYIRRNDADDTKYQRLGVDAQQKIVLGRGISPAEALRSEQEMREELGPAESGRERHHLIPLSVAARHSLVREAMSRGVPPYGPNSGLVYLPKNEESAKNMPGLPIHSGSHPRWSERVETLLDEKQFELISAFETLDNVPGADLTAEVRSVQGILSRELRNWSRLE